MIIQKYEYLFEVEKDRTQDYYTKLSPCDCPYCRNDDAQVGDCFLKMKAFLEEVGVDILKPDEIGSIENEQDHTIAYIFAAYTVCGQILRSDTYDFDIHGSRLLSVVVQDNDAPREHPIDQSFVFIVYSIVLP